MHAISKHSVINNFEKNNKKERETKWASRFYFIFEIHLLIITSAYDLNKVRIIMKPKKKKKSLPKLANFAEPPPRSIYISSSYMYVASFIYSTTPKPQSPAGPLPPYHHPFPFLHSSSSTASKSLLSSHHPHLSNSPLRYYVSEQ